MKTQNTLSNPGNSMPKKQATLDSVMGNYTYTRPKCTITASHTCLTVFTPTCLESLKVFAVLCNIPVNSYIVKVCRQLVFSALTGDLPLEEPPPVCVLNVALTYKVHSVVSVPLHRGTVTVYLQ